MSTPLAFDEAALLRLALDRVTPDDGHLHPVEAVLERTGYRRELEAYTGRDWSQEWHTFLARQPDDESRSVAGG